MLSTLFKIGPIPIHSYGLLIAIGFLLALHLIQREAVKQSIDPEVVSNIAFWCLFLGIAGTRVLHIIMYPENYAWNDPIGWIAIWRGGLVFQGALVPTIPYVLWACRKNGLSFWKFADLVAPYLPLGHAFGRLGCFMHGCCYGARTDLPWGIRFPRVPWDLTKPAEGSPAYLDHCTRYSTFSSSVEHWSYPVHPTQLYGATGLFLGFLLLVYLRKHWHPFVGYLLPLYLMLYGAGRFFVEFLRADHNPTMGVLTFQQVFSLVGIAIGGLMLVWLKKRATRAASPEKAAKR